MSYAHKGQILPLVNQMIPIDKETTFHASYDYHLNGMNQGEIVSPISEGRILRFNGSNGYIDIPGVAELLHGEKEATIEMWVKKNSVQYGFIQLSGFANGNGNLYPYQDSLTVYLDIFRTDRLGPITMNSPVTEWHHFAVTMKDGADGWKLYQNGELVYSAAGQPTVSTNYYGFEIGRNSGSRYADGEFSNVRIWNRVLSQDQIKKNMYKAAIASESNLVGQWKLNEQEGPISFDLSDNGNDGVWNGGITSIYGPTVATLKKEEGKFRGGVLIEQDTVNLLAGKSIIVDTQYGIVGGEDAIGKYFIPSGRQYGWAGIRIPTTSVTEGKKNTWSLEIKCEDAISINWDRNASGGTYTGNDAAATLLDYSTSYTTPGEWQKVYITVEMKPDATSGTVYHTLSSTTDKKIYYRNWQLEERDYPTSYTDGSRPLGKLWYSNQGIVNPNSFTISCLFKSPYVHKQNTDNAGMQGNWYHPIIEVANDTNTGDAGLSIVITPAANYSPARRLELRSPRTGGTGTYTSTSTIEDDVWNHMAVTYDGTVYKGYLNGVLEFSYTAPPQPITEDMFLMVGGGYHGKPSIIIDEVRVESRAISQEEAQAWAASGLHYNYLDYSMVVD
jgi:hypothetical protein